MPPNWSQHMPPNWSQHMPPNWSQHMPPNWTAVLLDNERAMTVWPVSRGPFGSEVPVALWPLSLGVGTPTTGSTVPGADRSAYGDTRMTGVVQGQCRGVCCCIALQEGGGHACALCLWSVMPLSALVREVCHQKRSACGGGDCPAQALVWVFRGKLSTSLVHRRWGSHVFGV